MVGVTCCSATLPLLDDLAFNVCLLDEASQIVEPSACSPSSAPSAGCTPPAKNWEICSKQLEHIQPVQSDYTGPFSRLAALLI